MSSDISLYFLNKVKYNLAVLGRLASIVPAKNYPRFIHPKKLTTMGFLATLKSYGKWDKTSSETLTEEEKQSVERIEVVEGQYGPTFCFFLKGTNRVNYVQQDDNCHLPVGTNVDPNSVVFNHYTDGSQVASRASGTALA